MHAFFERVLPAQGHYRLVELGTTPKTTWYSSIDALASAAEQRRERARVYFGTASYRQPTTGHAANVLLNRALRLDLDAGADKYNRDSEAAYPTREAALNALIQFNRASGVKPSHLVSSGHGWHAYYAMTEALEPPAWKDLAARLALACVRHNLKADPAVTGDITRLLRVPGTLHSAQASSPRVQVVRQGAVLTPAEVQAWLPAPPGAGQTDLNDAFSAAHADREYAPSSALKIAGRCDALAQVAHAHGDVSEPLWRAMIGLVKHTTEGEALIHDWSRGHDRYDPRETDAKIDAWRAGPTTCDEFARHCGACRTCPQRGHIKSPIALGEMNDAEQERLPPEQRTTAPVPPPAPQGEVMHPWDGALPPDSRVVDTPEGGHRLEYALRQAREDADGNVVTARIWVPVTSTIFWFARWGESVGGENAQAALRACIGGRVVQFELDQACLCAPAELAKALASRAIHLSTHPQAAKAAHLYAKSQFAMLQANHPDLTITDHFGLHVTPEGELVAVHGRYTLHGDGEIRDTILGRALRESARAYTLPIPNGGYANAWGPDAWAQHIMPRARQYVDFLRRFYGGDAYRCYQLAIMAAIASPLMAFVTGEYRGARLPQMSTLTLSLYSLHGGYGKTAACQAAMMAYGDPGVLVCGQGQGAATGNARHKRLSISGTMPNGMDEMGGISPAQAYETLSITANGADKFRLKQDGAVIDSTPWSLVNLVTTNRPLQELLRAPGASRSDAVQRRILEIDTGGVPLHPPQEREDFALEYGRTLSQCAGALGAVLQREICRLGLDEAHRLVARGVSAAQRLLAAEQNDRFLYRGLGAILAASALLKNLDLLPFDAAHTAATYKQAYSGSLQSAQLSADMNDPLAILNQALIDLLPCTLITDDETRGNKIDRVYNDRMPLEVKARHVRRLGRSYVSVDALRQWLSGNQLTDRDILPRALAEGILIRPKAGRVARNYWRKNLMLGTPMNTGQGVMAYTFDTRKLEERLAAQAGEDMDTLAEHISQPQPEHA